MSLNKFAFLLVKMDVWKEIDVVRDVENIFKDRGYQIENLRSWLGDVHIIIGSTNVLMELLETLFLR